MMTRDEILEIDQYCQEHKISHRQRLEELNIPFWNFYRAKRKYRQEDVSQSQSGGEFLQISPRMMPVRNGRCRKSASTTTDSQVESYLTIELRTTSGTEMRIQGNMTAAHLRELISAGNV